MAAADKKILVVDDEPKITEVVRSYLEKNGYTVFEAYDGRKAIELFERVNPALIVLDLMLPDMTGEEVCSEIRKKSRVPIIMLTAKIEDENIINGLDMGADDYVTKPFSPKQLVARIAAVLRRTQEEAAPLAAVQSFNKGDLVIDSKSRDVRKNGVSVNLTPNEFNLFIVMVKYPKRVFTRDELITLAISEDFEGYDRIIDTHIKNLRQKIETDPKNPVYVITVHGVGYKFGGDQA